MAEKGFGVKEVNLIGASGTPTITSPNNLNLNANNVAISTNVSIGGTLSVTGNVSVGGTLTYEDVTSIDSVGIVTARTGVVTPNVDVDDFISVGSNIHLGNAGVVTATTFSGSGASLTSIPAGQLTGTVADARISTLTASKLSGALPAISGANLTNLPATDPTNSDIQVVYAVTANGSSAYRFAGNGVVSTADDPDLYLIRGQKYRFINNSGGSHPFQIRESSGGSAYSTGVTNNGAASGNIDFAPTYDSPAQLVYQCTSHSGMVGNIYLRDAAGGNTNVGITTFSTGIQFTPVMSQMYSQDGALSYYATNNGVYLNGAGASGWLRLQAAGSSNDRTSINLTGHSASGNPDTIQFNTNTTERLRIDANGYLVKASGLTCAFNVSGTNMTRNDTSGYVCDFDDDTSSGNFDSGNNFNTTTHEFTAPVSGYYYFFTNIRLDSFNSGYIRTAILSTSYHAGTTYYDIPSTGHVITYADNGSIQTVQTSTVMYMPATHKAWVYQNPNSDSSYTCYLNESSFGGYFIG